MSAPPPSRLPVPLQLAFVLTLAVIGAGAVFSHRSTLAVRDHNREVAHTEDIRAAAGGLVSALQDAETGQRGFVITGEEAFLEPYRRAERAVPEELRRLHELVANEPEHARRVVALAPVVDAKMSELRRVIEVRERQGMEAAGAIVAAGEGKRAMDSIRALLGEVNAAEDADLVVRRAALDAATGRMITAIGLAALLSASLVALLFLALRRHLATRQSLLAAEREARVAVETRAAEQQRADAALRDQATRTQQLVQRLDTIIETMGEGLYTVDATGTVTFLNSAAERLLGWTRENLLGRKMHDATHYLHPDGTPFPASECAGLQVLRSGTPLVHHDDVFIRKDGTFMPVVYSSSRLQGESGGVAGLVVVFRDVTRERAAVVERETLLATTERARQEAEAASRAKDLFLATVSHELRTPLSPIIAWSAMLEQESLDPARTKQAHQTILRSARAQAQVIEDLLDVSRIISGKMRLAVRPVDLRAVIEAAVEVVRPAAEAKAVRLHVVLDTETAPISGDAERLQQVVWNLLSNSIKFTPRGGRVNVVLERVNSQVEIAVTDTGQGISAEFLPHVFDRFQQADASTTRQYAGLGLGLAIARHLVEAHGGTIHAESPGQGRGAAFTVKLPLVLIARVAGEAVRRHPTEVPLGDHELPALDGVRILVVDDEPDSNEVVRTLLAERGAEVRVAASAAQALALLDRWTPDVLVSDIGMPGEDGYSLLAKVRARGDGVAQLPAVALTAYASVDDRVRLLSAGFARHVPKPVEPLELVAVVSGLAGRRP